MMLEFYGREAGLRHARKQVGWYLDRCAPHFAAERKAALMTEKNADVVARILWDAIATGADNASREAA